MDMDMFALAISAQASDTSQEKIVESPQSAQTAMLAGRHHQNHLHTAQQRPMQAFHDLRYIDMLVFDIDRTVGCIHGSAILIKVRTLTRGDVVSYSSRGCLPIEIALRMNGPLYLHDCTAPLNGYPVREWQVGFAMCACLNMLTENRGL